MSKPATEDADEMRARMEKEWETTSAAKKPPVVSPKPLLDSAGKPVTSAAKPAAPPKPPINPAAPVEPKIEDLYNAVGEGFAKSPPPAAAKPAAKPAAPDPAEAEAERRHQKKTDALQEESLRGTKSGRDFLRANRTYDQRNSGAIQGGTGKTSEDEWRRMFPDKPKFAAAAPLAAAPGRAAAKPAAKPAAPPKPPTNPAAPRSVSITTGMREKLTATTGVPALNEPGKATMQLQVAEMKAPADSALGLENFAGGTIDHNAINKLAAPPKYVPGEDSARDAEEIRRSDASAAKAAGPQLDFTKPAFSADPLAPNYSPTTSALASAAPKLPTNPAEPVEPNIKDLYKAVGEAHQKQDHIPGLPDEPPDDEEESPT